MRILKILPLYDFDGEDLFSQLGLVEDNHYSNIEELTDSFILKILMVEVNEEDIYINIQGFDLYINNKKNPFTPNRDMTFKSEYRLKEKYIRSWKEGNWLSIEVKKPKNYNFNIKVDGRDK